MNYNTFIEEFPAANTIIKPYIIAEAGVNHEGSIDIAKRLIEEAAEGGADAIKFQTYKADKIASKQSPSYWDTSKETCKSQYELFKKYDKFWKNEYDLLKKHCDEHNIEFMSTPFDIDSADFLNDLMSVFKISSSDLNNKPFIEHICKYKKPVILSTGAAYLYEIFETVEWINKYGNHLTLLHCVLNYPTENKNAQLITIKKLIQYFPDNIIGYSDHTLPGTMKVLEIATLLGAKVIEKHFTHDKSLPGNDHYHAMDKNDLQLFNQSIIETLKIIGNLDITSQECEEKARINARRSLVAKRIIPKGKIISYKDITWKRPAFGIEPKYVDVIIGSLAMMDIKKDEAIQWHMLKKTS